MKMLRVMLGAVLGALVLSAGPAYASQTWPITGGTTVWSGTTATTRI